MTPAKSKVNLCVPTHAEIIAALQGQKCPVDRRRKAAGVSFCAVCIRKLPGDLYRPLLANGGDQFDAPYLIALGFLQGLRKRRVEHA